MKKVLLILVSAIFLSGCVIGGISPQKAEDISAKFIEILAPGAGVQIKTVEKAAGGDFKIVVDANGQEVISYLSPDGTIFYPQGLNIAELTKQFEEFQKQQQAGENSSAELENSDENTENKDIQQTSETEAEITETETVDNSDEDLNEDSTEDK